MALPKLFAALGLAACLELGAWSAGAQLLQPLPARPDALMNALTSELIALLRQDLAAGRPGDAAQLVESRLVLLFDFHRMTSSAMARNWRLASPQQQEALVVQFRALLARNYSRVLSDYRYQELEYRPLRIAAGETEVLVRSSLTLPGAQALTIDYDMASGVAGWRVFDIKIDGASLVMNYREAFAAEVRNRGIDGLIESLSESNRQGAASAKVADGAKLAPLLMIYFGAARARP